MERRVAIDWLTCYMGEASASLSFASQFKTDVEGKNIFSSRSSPISLFDCCVGCRSTRRILILLLDSAIICPNWKETLQLIILYTNAFKFSLLVGIFRLVPHVVFINSFLLSCVGFNDDLVRIVAIFFCVYVFFTKHFVCIYISFHEYFMNVTKLLLHEL